MGRHNIPNSSKYDKGKRTNVHKSLPPPRKPLKPDSRIQANAKNDDCFIATSVYGSRDHHNINVLRKYRDDILKKSHIGRSLIVFYYNVSPPVAKIISQRPVLKRIIKKILLDPIIEMLKKK